MAFDAIVLTFTYISVCSQSRIHNKNDLVRSHNAFDWVSYRFIASPRDSKETLTIFGCPVLIDFVSMTENKGIIGKLPKGSSFVHNRLGAFSRIIQCANKSIGSM